MAMIVAGRFTTFDEAEGGARHLYERAFGPDDVSIFFLNPGGQHARYPIGGDVYADTAAKPGGRGAMVGALRGMLIGVIVGLIAYAIGLRYWFVPVAGALAARISAPSAARSDGCAASRPRARARSSRPRAA